MTTYTPPTGPELRSLLRRWDLTGAAAAALLAVSPRTVRRWTGGERAMPFAALYLLANVSIYVKVWPETWREVLLP